MPIVANPADPFAPKISEKFGATEQWNRIAPLLAQQYEAAANRQHQASVQSAQNQTQGNIASASLQGRKQGQDAEIEASREQQDRQIAAQMEMQQRQVQARLAEQQMENDRYNFAITRHEETENVARQNGLAEIEKQLSDHTLTPEQAGDARMQLISKIKAFDNRKMSQQAKAIEQQTKMETLAFDNNQKNIVLAQQLGKATAGQNWIPITQHNGDTEFYGYDPQKGTFYQIGKRTAASEKEKPVSAYADEGGGFSYKKALPEAKAEAEAAYPILKNDEGKDTNAQKRAEYIQEMVKKREDEHRAGMNKGSQAPVTAPQQQQGGVAEQLMALQQQFPDPSKAPPDVQQQMRKLYQQYKSQ